MEQALGLEGFISFEVVLREPTCLEFGEFWCRDRGVEEVPEYSRIRLKGTTDSMKTT